MLGDTRVAQSQKNAPAEAGAERERNSLPEERLDVLHDSGHKKIHLKNNPVS
jgi:hypothetical protein